MKDKTINGNKLAEKIISVLKNKRTPKLELAAILIGQDKASLSFLKNKSEVAKQLGVKFNIYKLSDKLSQKEIEKNIYEINKKKTVSGVIIQLPLPKKYNIASVLNIISPDKDTDALNSKTSQFLAPAVGALEFILKQIKFDLKNKKVVVVGSGHLVGRPVSDWMMNKVKKLTILNKGGFDIKSLKDADLVVTGAGEPDLIKGENLKKDVVVIDYGYGKKNGKLAGDIEIKSIEKVASYFTPTPGGTGPIVVAKLFENFYNSGRS